MYGDDDNSLLGMERRLGDKIELVRVEVAGMNGTFTAQHEALQNRIISLEQTNVRNNWREWIKMAVMVPITIMLHKLLNFLGVKI